MAEQASYRLPRTVVPERYQLELAPDLAKATFSGTVSIRVRVTEPVEQLVLNAAELVVSQATVRPPQDGTAPGIDGTVALDEDAERLHVSLPQPLSAGTWILDLVFTGVLNDKLRGFYRSTWTDDAGTEQVIASTQFEPADARRAFPCWDEPDFKATFAVTLVIDEVLTAISNGTMVADEPAGDGRRRVRFAETMPMSTYLVACIVGPFELTAPTDVDGTPLRVATVPGKQKLTDFAIEVGGHALRFLAGYFDIPYPHDKLDHVAIPDFAMGAMENLGCVTYRETALLLDPQTSSQLEQRRVAEVVCHETAHMWFGDLVTMRWWNGIWLNEAFATFMEATASDAFRPEWRIWTAFGTTKAMALSVDGLAATRPIEYPVGPPDEAEAMFDVLTYEKGCAVLRMLEQYLSPEVFRRGINAYLDEHRHANTETTDLWDAIESTSGEPVRPIMDSWIFQGGYPLVRAESGPDATSIVLTQGRFLYDKSGENGGGQGGERWKVPINLRASVAGRVSQTRVLLEDSSTVVDFGGKLDWVVVNDGGWGFYRVQYDGALDALLPAVLSETSALERLTLANDSWALVVAGDSDLASWAGLVGRLRDEDDPDVWLAILGPVDLLDLVAAEADRSGVRSFVRRLAGPALERLGWDRRPGDAGGLGITRSRLIAALGTVGADAAVRAEADATPARLLGRPRIPRRRPGHGSGQRGRRHRRRGHLPAHGGAHAHGGHPPGEDPLPVRPGPARGPRAAPPDPGLVPDQ